MFKSKNRVVVVSVERGAYRFLFGDSMQVYGTHAHSESGIEKVIKNFYGQNTIVRFNHVLEN